MPYCEHPSEPDVEDFASDFAMPPVLTAGKNEIEVELSVLPPVETPLVAGPEVDPLNEFHLATIRALNAGGWTDILYQVYSLGN